MSTKEKQVGQMGKATICTFDELCAFAYGQVFCNEHQKKDFHAITFTASEELIGIDKEDITSSAAEIAEEASLQLGIRRIDFGFDDPDLMLAIGQYGIGLLSLVQLQPTGSLFPGSVYDTTIEDGILKALWLADEIDEEDALNRLYVVEIECEEEAG